MYQNDFNIVIEQQIDRSRDMLINKNAHYNAGDDKLASFKRAAAAKETTSQNALAGMMVKHTTSVYDLCNIEDVTETPLAVWNEKITDHINYLLLLRAVVEEAHSKRSTTINEIRVDSSINAEEAASTGRRLLNAERARLEQ